MSIEELKLILEAVGQLGDAGKTAFIVWVLVENLSGVLGWIFTVSMLAVVALKITRTVADAGEHKRPPLTHIQAAALSARTAWLYGQGSEESAQAAYAAYVLLKPFAEEGHERE